ncbi:MAG: RNA polymerase sigma factor [Planctomycetota bacterium]
MAACVSGDEAAWKEFVSRYGQLVYSIPHRYGLDTDACEDIFQEVFSILIRQLSGIRRRSGLPKWFITTTHRVCRDWFRQARRQAGGVPRFAKAEAPPPDLVLHWERQQVVRQALRRLGGRCEELLTALYANQGTAKYEDVAKQIGVPIGSIGPMRARCLQRLMELVADLEKEHRP